MDASKGKRHRRKLARFLGGGTLAIGGFGFGFAVFDLTSPFWVVPVLIGFVGLAFMTGYIRKPVDWIDGIFNPRRFR